MQWGEQSYNHLEVPAAEEHTAVEEDIAAVDMLEAVVDTDLVEAGCCPHLPSCQ